MLPLSFLTLKFKFLEIEDSENEKITSSEDEKSDEDDPTSRENHKRFIFSHSKFWIGFVVIVKQVFVHYF